MGQCCASDTGKVTTDGLIAPGNLTQNRATRKLESATKAAQAQEELNSSKASFSTDYSGRDRADTYNSDTTVRSSSSKRGLSITIPNDPNDEHNPYFKTPVDADSGKVTKFAEEEEFDDENSEIMIM